MSYTVCYYPQPYNILLYDELPVFTAISLLYSGRCSVTFWSLHSVLLVKQISFPIRERRRRIGYIYTPVTMCCCDRWRRDKITIVTMCVLCKAWPTYLGSMVKKQRRVSIGVIKVNASKSCHKRYNLFCGRELKFK